MSGEINLARLLATMSPQHLPGSFVFVTINGSLPEREGKAVTS
jgi:hypothetical protein